MGINVLSNPTGSEIVNLIAGQTISSGDLIVNTETGRSVIADTTLTLAQNNNNTNGAPAATAVASVSTWLNSRSGNNMVLLSTGNIAIAFTGDTTSNENTGLNISIRNEANNLVFPTDTSITTSSIENVIVRNLSTTGFVVAWVTSTTFNFRIYNNDLTVAVGTTVVSSSLTSGGANNTQMQVLGNGDIVFAYRTSTNAAFTRYNSSGVIQGAETIIAADTPISFSILSHSSGDFWIYFQRTVTTLAWKFARYNSSGVLQGSITTVNSGASANISSGNAINLLTELSNGNVVVISRQSNMNYAVYSSTGASVLSNTLLSSASSTFLLQDSRAPSVVVLSNSFAFVGKRASNQSLYFFEILNTGVRTGPTKEIPANIGSSAFLDFATVRFNGAYFSIVGTQTTEGCGGNSQNFILTFDYSGALRGSGTYFAPASTFTLNGLASVIYPNGIIAITYSENSTNRPAFFGVYDTVRKSIIGIAQESAVTNASFRVATNGIFNSNQTIGFGGNFNNTAATVPGAKGSLVGTSVSLRGLS